MAPTSVLPASSSNSSSGPSQTSRVRLQAIHIQLKNESRYPTFLELTIDRKVRHKFPKIERGQDLQWKSDVSFDISPKSVINVQVCEARILFPRTAASFSCSGQQVLEQWSSTSRELKVSQKGSSMTVQFASLASAVNLVSSEAAARKAVAAAGNVQSTLSELGHVRSALETIMDIAGELADIHPFAKVAFTAVNMAFKHLEQQEAYDSNIRDLSLGMADMLSFVKIVQERAKILKLKEIVIQMMKLIEDASVFIVDYLSDGRFQRYVESTVSSSAQRRIDDYIQQFNVLKDQFDRGVDVQVLDTVMSMQEEAILAHLHSVVAGCGPSYDEEHTCMEGTRKKILEDIDAWAADKADSQSLLWMHGLAGSGKSSIASSVAKRLHEQNRLGATFSCKRDHPHLRDPTLVIPRIASRLAAANKLFGKAVAAALQEEPNLPMDAISLQFRGLIRTTAQKVSGTTSERPYIVIVDALDECGNSDSTRALILSLLKEMADQVPWIKVIITSRPDPDICSFFEVHNTGFRRLDLDKEEPFDDILAFVTKRMGEIARRYPSLPPTWPGEEITKTFACRSGCLFVWAEVASNFVAKALDPQRNLDIMLSETPRSGGRGPYAHLDELYKTALGHNIEDDEEDTEVFRDVIGTIVAVSTRDPLPIKVLKALFAGEGISPLAVDNTIRRLQSVVYEDLRHGNAVRLCHPSFMDFLTNPSRCPPQFFIDLAQQNANLARMCLRTMTSGLKFNICGLKSSHQFNADVVGLKSLVDSGIPKSLAYSSVHWHNHLGDASKDEQARKQISQYLDGFFSQARPLYWLEVLSLLGALPSAISGLPRVVGWLENPEDENSRFADDIHRFVAAFYEPISRSAPHLYISALPFAPRQSIVSKRILPLFQNVISVTSGQENNWSACLHTSEGHTGKVFSVAISPDGERIVSGSADKTIRIWDAETGAPVTSPLEGHSSGVMSVAFSADSRRIASGSKDGTIRVWDAETGAAVSCSREGHSDTVNSIAFSPDGRQIVSGSRDSTIRIWDAETCMTVCGPLEGHSGKVFSVAISPDGRRVASGSRDKTIRIWDVRTGAPTSRLIEGHTAEVTTVIFSPDGRRIASGSVDKTIRIWDAETGAAVLGPFMGHFGEIFSIAFFPDGRRIVSASWDKTIGIWDATTGTMFPSRLEGHSDAVIAVVYSPDGRRIISGSRDKTIRIWDADVGAGATREQHSSEVWRVAFSPDSQRIASGGWDRVVRIWDAETGAEVCSPLKGHSGHVCSVVFSPDGRRLVSGSSDTTIRIWDLETSTEVCDPLEGHTEGIVFLALSPNSQRFASASGDKTIRIWDLEACVMVTSPFKGHSDAVMCVAFSPDGRKIVSASRDKTVRVWDVETGAVYFSCEGHSDEVYSIAMSPDGRRIVSGSADMTVRIWDAETGAEISIPLRGHSSMVYNVTFSPDGRHIASGSADTTIRLWDAEMNMAVPRVLKGHSGLVMSVVFSPDGRRIGSGSIDKTVRIWDAGTEEVTHGHPGEVVSTAPTNGWQIVSGPVNKQIRESNADTTPPDQAIDAPALVDLAGWIRQSQDAALLLWVPLTYRLALIDQSTTIIPSFAAITIDFSDFCHGTSWSEVHST